MGNALLASMPAEGYGTKTTPQAETSAQKFFLYQNGLCEEDTDTPDDFYPPKQPTKKGKKG
jgi:hypothetical protein